MIKFFSKIFMFTIGLLYFTNTSVFAHNLLMKSEDLGNHHESLNHKINHNDDELNIINHTNCQTLDCKIYCYYIENNKITAISAISLFSQKNTQYILKSDYNFSINNIFYDNKLSCQKIYNNGPPLCGQKFMKFADLVGVVILIC